MATHRLDWAQFRAEWASRFKWTRPVVCPVLLGIEKFFFINTWSSQRLAPPSRSINNDPDEMFACEYIVSLASLWLTNSASKQSVRNYRPLGPLGLDFSASLQLWLCAGDSSTRNYAIWAGPSGFLDLRSFFILYSFFLGKIFIEGVPCTMGNAPLAPLTVQFEDLMINSWLTNPPLMPIWNSKSRSKFQQIGQHLGRGDSSDNSCELLSRERQLQWAERERESGHFLAKSLNRRINYRVAFYLWY